MFSNDLKQLITSNYISNVFTKVSCFTTTPSTVTVHLYVEYVREKGYIWIHTETAWGELGDWRNFIEDKFDVFFYYYTEEPGCVIYETNDSEGCYFPYRYMMFEEVRQEYNYYSTLSELTKDVGNLLGVSGLETVDDCRDAFKGYIKEHGEICYYINEIEVVDW